MLGFLTLTIVVVILDVILRFKKLDHNHLRSSEITFCIIVFISLLIETKNFGILSVFGASIFTMAMVFKEIISNLGASLLLFLYPSFNENDILTNVNFPNHEPLIFSDVGILRSTLKTSTGKAVLVPNNILVTDFISIS